MDERKVEYTMTNLICIATIWINLTNLPWNDHDKKIYKSAVHTCKTNVRYKDDTPCVKSFTKSGFQMYRVICGRPKK